jgi:hypothetical protein
MKSVMEHVVSVAPSAMVYGRRELLRGDDIGKSPDVFRIPGAHRRPVAVQTGTGVGTPHEGNDMCAERTEYIHPLEEGVRRFQSHDEDAIRVARSEHANGLFQNLEEPPPRSLLRFPRAKRAVQPLIPDLETERHRLDACVPVPSKGSDISGR